jgi:hypothetical protein
MNIGLYGLVIVFGAFIILLIINPNLSCFGKRLKSPFYPLVRKKKISAAKHGRRPPTTEGPGRIGASANAQTPDKRAEDYGFHLDE